MGPVTEIVLEYLAKARKRIQRTWKRGAKGGHYYETPKGRRVYGKPGEGDTVGEYTPAEKKPKAKKKKVRDTSDVSLAEYVLREHGDINPNDHSLKTSYKNMHEAIENGIPLRVFRKMQGSGLDEIAASMQENGMLQVPENRHAPEYLLELMTKKAKADYQDSSKRYDKLLEEHYKAEQEAHDAKISESQIAAAIRDGESDARREVTEELLQKHGIEFDEADYGGHVESGSTDFDFGANEEVKEEVKQQESTGDISDYLDPTQYATKQEYEDAEYNRLMSIMPDLDDETAKAQVQMWSADRWVPPPEKGKYTVGQEVQYGDSIGNFRGTFTDSNGKKFAVVAGGKGGQISVPFEQIGHVNSKTDSPAPSAPSGPVDLFGRPLPKQPTKAKAGQQITLDDQIRDLWHQKAEEFASDKGQKIDQRTAGGQFRIGQTWYQVGKQEDGYPITETTPVTVNKPSGETRNIKTVPADENKPMSKEPWQMTRDEYTDHAAAIPKNYGPWNDEVGSDRYSKPLSQTDKIFEKVVKQKLAETTPGSAWPFPPVTVSRSSGPYDLKDGHHRIEVAKRLGMRIIPAVLTDPKAFGHTKPVNTYVEIDGDGSPRIIQPNNESLPPIKVTVPESNPSKKRIDHNKAHYSSVKSALSTGKPVPAEVLADYPDLAAKYKKS